MASTSKCAYCGNTMSSEDKTCPNCGAPNPNYVADTPRRVFLPKTIEELKEYCAERGMPLLKMRFFIGEDYKEPKAFGICQAGDDFIVYKNKADGSRSVRYQGPDEEHAVNELFQKLLQECHNRGIYPDGKPQSTTTVKRKRSASSGLLSNIAEVIVVFYLLYAGGSALMSRFRHTHDGYYRINEDIYYRYGDDWYYDSDLYGWTECDFDEPENYQEYYLGEDFTSDWGVTDFKDSKAWERIEEDNSSSSEDYDDWDSGDTDWDSDW